MNIIFHFSGTGNSLFLAKSLASGLAETEVVPIQKMNTYPLDSYQRIGFIFPVYYIHAPHFVIAQLRQVRLHQKQQIFLIANAAGTLGYALRDAYTALSVNNQRLIHREELLIQEFCVRMPGNYILEYGASSLHAQEKMIKKAGCKMDSILSVIQHGELTKKIKPNILAILFQHKGIEKPRQFHRLGMEFYHNQDCTSCGRCVEICPVQNIVEGKDTITWLNHCEQCMACVQWCPKQAITHPQLRARRKRYTNPFIKISEMENTNE